jgi:hypothetical protein
MLVEYIGLVVNRRQSYPLEQCALCRVTSNSNHGNSAGDSSFLRYV